jgi:hypothetical protein
MPRPPQGINRLRKKSEVPRRMVKYVSPRLKPISIPLLLAGVETPASLRIEFFRGV